MSGRDGVRPQEVQEPAGRPSPDTRFAEGRRFLGANWQHVLETPSDQTNGVPVPLQEKPARPDQLLVALPDPGKAAEECAARVPGVAAHPVTLMHSLLAARRSRRVYDDSGVSLAQLSFLLWSCEGIVQNKGKFSFRTAPSGGARNPLDLYVFVRRVEGLTPGLYRYLPLEHALVLENGGAQEMALDEALYGQLWNSAVLLVWVAVPYRSEWRYGKAADKIVAMDAAHSCGNLYLACEAMELGTCAMGKYDQEKLDRWLGVDGSEEFAIYAAPVGRPVQKPETPPRFI